MPNYERWKYCGHIMHDGAKCGRIADAECTQGCKHPDEDFKGWAHPPENSELADHPRFLCIDHLELYNH